MKKFYTLIFVLISYLTLNAQTVWTGETITFTKPNNADWTLAKNQDRITDNVWITRQDRRGILSLL